MKTKEAQVKIIINKNHLKKDGKCAVYIRVTYKRLKKFYPTGKSLTFIDFAENVFKPNPGKALKEIANKLKEDEVEARSIIKKMPNFSFEHFEKRFITNRDVKDTIEGAFTSAINKLTENDQIGTAVSYGCAKKSFENFRHGLKFTDITVPLLSSYEKWMLENKRSTTTISIYARHLRTLFNNAITDGVIPKELYPFGEKLYQVPESNNTKKAITLEEVAKIFHYEVQEKSTAERAKAYWLFSYFCNGINMKDMALLKWENIKGNMICFKRSKTVRTKRKIDDIEVEILPRMMAIIKKFGNKQTKSEYIFPILTNGLSATRQRQLIQQITHVVNDHMKVIGKELGIEITLTSYVARHTMATVLKRNGASTEKISEALGHSNLKTTQAYLASFDKESKIELANILNSF